MTEFNLDDFLPYRLSILSQTISQLIAQEYESQFSLSMNQWRCIVIIHNHKDITAKGICEYALLDKMTVSRALKVLTGRKLVVATAALEDARKQKLNLTNQGKVIYNNVLPIARKYEESLLSALSESQIDNLREIFAKLMQVSKEMHARNLV